jgi:hypothetical protein
MRGAAVLFLSILLLETVIGQLNHEFSGLHLYVFGGGLFVTYSALAAELRQGMAASFAGWLLVDSVTPVPFGTHALLFSGAHAILFGLRDRLGKEEGTTRIAIALVANGALFIALSLVEHGKSSPGGPLWPRLFCDLLMSEVFVLAVAPWFLALQARAMSLAGANPRTP